eukprot:GFUD01136936.1.p1 GENE.GFUD01136936.1~~GFUD01136936.1.p1  ORF type:complete len:184 (+),score=42.49 GFUD01136936.1:22-552(+)
MCLPLSVLLSTYDAVECLVHFLSVEDALALACTSKCWRVAVNQEMIWRLLGRREREEEENKPNYLRKEYTEYVEKYKESSFDPICEEAFVLIYPHYLERSWNDYMKMRCDSGWEENEPEERESQTIDSIHKQFLTLTTYSEHLFSQVITVTQPVMYFIMFLVGTLVVSLAYIKAEI